MRVQLTPTSRDQQARAGDEHAGGDQERGRAGVAGDAHALEHQLVGVDDRDVTAVAVDGHPGAQQHPLGVVAAALGLADGRRAVGGERREQHARLDLSACDGQLVGDRVQARAADGQAAGSARRGPPARRPSERSGSAIRSTGRRRIESSPSSVNERPSCAASQPGSRRSSVPALPTSIGPSGSRASRRPVPRIDRLHVADLHERAERAHRLERRVGVGRVQIVLDPHRLGGHRPEQRGAVGDRLVRRRAQLAGESAGRARSACSSRAPHAARHRGSRGRRSARARPEPAPRRVSTARRRPGGCPRRARAPCRRCSRPRARARARSRRSRPGGWAPTRAARDGPARQARRRAARRARRARARSTPSPLPRRPARAARAPRRGCPRARRSPRSARRGWTCRCRSRSRCWRRRRAWRRGSSARRPAVRLASSLAEHCRGLGDEHVGEHVRQVRDARHQAVVGVGVDRGGARAEAGQQSVQALVEHARGAAPARACRYQVAPVEEVLARVLHARPSQRRRAGARRRSARRRPRRRARAWSSRRR